MSSQITSEAILNEDGAEVPLAQFAAEVRAGETEIRRLISNEPGRRWGFSELRDAAAEGRRKTAMGAALMSLDRQGVVNIDYALYSVVPA